jgi:hypothetical protein
MNYIKKMCILRQVKQGFSGDGKTLSGLVKIEQYGKNLAVEVSIINFAPLSSGEYYCLLSDGAGKTEMLALRGKSLFNILSDIDISHGFCAVICYAKTEIVPIAYGVSGNGSYDWKAILNATLPPIFPQTEAETGIAVAPTPPPEPPVQTPVEKADYDDEDLAEENYFEEEESERFSVSEDIENARLESANQNENASARIDSAQNANDASVRQAFTTESKAYYRTVKDEIDLLFRTHPKDDTLKDAFGCGEWVRIKGDEGNPEYLVGVLYEDGEAKYLCYALRADDPENPPEEIAEVCSFVPVTPFLDCTGFFVIFQSTATGECLKPAL